MFPRINNLFRILVLLCLTIVGCFTSCGPNHDPVSFSLRGARGEDYWLAEFSKIAKYYAEPMPVPAIYAADYIVHIEEFHDLPSADVSVFSVVVCVIEGGVERRILTRATGKEVYTYHHYGLVVDDSGDLDEVVVQIQEWLIKEVLEKEGHFEDMDPYWYNAAVREAVEKGEIPRRFENRRNLDYNDYDHGIR